MKVRMISIEWNAQGEQVHSEKMSIRAHKEPVMPERFATVSDGVWQEQHNGRAMMRLTTWTATN